MRKSSRNIILSLILIIGFSTYAQNSTKNSHTLTIHIPEVALLSVQSTTNLPITLKGSTVTEAGKELIFNETDQSIWLNYSSIIGSKTEPSRSISLQITQGAVPDGLQLSVNVKDDAGKGAGKLGKPINSIQKVTEGPIKIIEQIGSSYTGSGTYKGHNIHYNLTRTSETSSYALLDFDQSQSIAITYTLSDN